MAKRRAKPAKAPTVNLGNFMEAFAKNLALAQTNPEALAGNQEQIGNPVTIAPRVPEAKDWADKQLARTAAAGEDWKRGVLRPKKNPVEAAKAANGKYKAKMQQALTEDRFLKGLGNVDLDEMYRTIEATDSSVFTAGVQRREGKIRKRVEEVRTDVLALTTTIDAMPQDTEVQREARVLAAVRGMRAIGKKRRS